MAPRDQTYLPLRVKQRNEPMLVFMLSSRDGRGRPAPYPSLGKTFEMFIKQDVEDPDPAPIPGVRLPDQDTRTETAVGVQIPPNELDVVRRLVYHLDSVSPRETVAWGPIIILDT